LDDGLASSKSSLTPCRSDLIVADIVVNGNQHQLDLLLLTLLSTASIRWAYFIIVILVD
jgi:hypothetical protein